jgi:hypothetical protein
VPNFTRHQIAYNLLSALRGAGLGVRDEFEGRQEPSSWFFRCLAYDQSELDIMESGAIDALHAPSALVELSLDEVAVAAAAIGPEGLISYLVWEADDEPFGDAEPPPDPTIPGLGFHPDVHLGYLALDVAPPTLWMEERRSDPESNEALARRLAVMAQQVGGVCDVVEVHIEGSLDASEDGWADRTAEVRPAGVSVHFTLEIPLAGTGERELSMRFDEGARTAAAAIEGMRLVFQRLSAGER